MSTQPLALSQIESLLGPAATDDDVWFDLRLFESTALPIVTTLWDLERLEQQDIWRILYHHNDTGRALHAERIDQAARQVQGSLGSATASRCAAAFFLHPQLWQAAYVLRHSYAEGYRERAQSQLLSELARACIAQRPPLDWVVRLCRRLITLCCAASPYSAPDVAACVGYLLACDEASTAPLLDALTVGDWHAAWERTVALAGPVSPIWRAGSLGSTAAGASGAIGPDRLKACWRERGAQHVVALLERLFQNKRLDAQTFRTALEALPGGLHAINAVIQQHAEQAKTGGHASAFIAELRRLLDPVLWEMLCDFRPETLPTLRHIGYLSGGRYLLRIGEEVGRHGITRLLVRHGVDQRVAVLAHLLGVLQRRADDDSSALVPLVQRLDVPTLLALLPHTRPYEAEICAALGWAGSAGLAALLHRLEASTPARSADPSAGVVWRQEILDIVSQIDELHLRTLLEAFAETRPAAVTLVRAALGWNRRDLRRLLGRRNQLAARALPLLPLEQPDELLQRYLMLTKYQREANSSGMGRKPYERAAAQAGLTNLALHAGYADATRLEWAMEDRLGTQGVSVGRQWAIEGYTLTLTLRDGGPALAVRNSKRMLKRTPSVVSRDYAYREVRATLEQAQDQQRRYRQALLDSMRRGQPIHAEELALLARNPLATALLERLILIDEAGAVGLFRPDDRSLEGRHGERVRITGAVVVAHPYTLVQAGLLVDWQATIVEQQIIQPFKQVFRELYLLTPAEAQAGYESGRLAGRRLKSRQALAVLANLGWIVDRYGTVQKPFYDLGYAAYFTAGGYGDDEEADATTGTLAFWPLNHHTSDGTERRIKLADVPPLVFSEVLRDLDLVTVIAHQSDELGASREVLQRRGDLVRAMAAALGLAEVRVEEPLVFVRGARAGYRVHLATAAIYLDSGQYLCIVPSPKERRATYLPFEDGGEPISSEIVSKVLLLAHDAQIADATILAQIAPLKVAA